MKNVSKAARFCCLYIILALGFCNVNGQVPGAKMNFSFIDKQPVKNVQLNLRNLLLTRPKPVQKVNTFALKALPLNEDALKVLPQLLGKKVDIKFLVTNKLTADRVLGITYSAQIISQYIELEKEYQSRLMAANPAQKEQLASQWNSITSEAIKQFSRGGLTVSRADIAGWAVRIKQSGLNQILNTVLKNAVPTADKIASPSSGSVAVSRTTGWLLAATNLPGLVADTITKGLGDICSKPLASGDFKRDWRASYDYTASIPYWCPTWSDWTKICHKTVTLFSFSIDLGIDIGYNITCCGGSCWATGSFNACAGVLGANICVNCTTGGTAVIGVGKSSSGGNCTYGIGINVSINCTILGFTIFDLNYPIWGYTITAPCPPAGFHCN